MNERIRELAKQADAYALKIIGDKWVGWEEIAPGWVECRDSKFAELIVRECVEQVFYFIEDEEEDNISLSIRNRIKEHFGVE